MVNNATEGGSRHRFSGPKVIGDKSQITRKVGVKRNANGNYTKMI